MWWRRRRTLHRSSLEMLFSNFVSNVFIVARCTVELPLCMVSMSMLVAVLK